MRSVTDENGLPLDNYLLVYNISLRAISAHSFHVRKHASIQKNSVTVHLATVLWLQYNHHEENYFPSAKRVRRCYNRIHCLPSLAVIYTQFVIVIF